MIYFQTDDRDDYFASLETKSRKPRNYSLVDPNGKTILSGVPTYKIRGFVKKNYPKFGNTKKIWRKAIESKGYKVITNIIN